MLTTIALTGWLLGWPVPQAWMLPMIAALKLEEARTTTVNNAQAIRKLDKHSTERLAKGSALLQKYLTEDAGRTRKLLERVELTPELEEQLKGDQIRALDNQQVYRKFVSQHQVVEAALQDATLRQQIDAELAEYQSLAAAANNASIHGDHEVAAKTYEQALGVARGLNNPLAQAQAMLDQARELEALSVPTSSEGLSQVLSLYDEASSLGDSDHQALAYNNKGVTLLRADRPKDAIANLTRTFDSVSPQQRPYLYFNLGRAHEQLGKPDEAYRYFLAALSQKKDFRVAAESAFRVVRTMQPDNGIKAAAELSKRLTANREWAVLQKELANCLQQWGGEPEVSELFGPIIDGYAKSGISRSEFQYGHRRQLQNIGEGAPLVQELTRALALAYEATLEVSVNSNDAWEMFPDWGRDGVPQNWAALLKSAGDAFANQGNTEQALARYLLSWNLDPDNTEAMVYIADVLVRNQELQEQHRAVVDQLIRRVFAAKGHSYSVPHKTEQDWRNLMRYHILLGTLFEQRGEFGSIHEVSSAVFQFERARIAEEQVRKHDPTLPPSPGIYLGLAEALRQSPQSDDGDRQEAMELYQRAAREFRKTGNVERAQHAAEQSKRMVDLDPRRVIPTGRQPLDGNGN